MCSTTRKRRRPDRRSVSSPFFPRPVSRFISRLVALATATLALTSCKFNEISIPETTPAVVVHAVLNPSALTQVVLVERTLTGAQPVEDSIFNPADPIRSDGGIPVSGATVALIDSTGRAFTGVEDHVNNDSQGTGVYRINLPALL